MCLQLFRLKMAKKRNKTQNIKRDKKRDKKRDNVNLLDLIPHPCVEWETNSDDKIDLLVPKFRHVLIERWIKRLGKSTVFRIHLDEFGSYAWAQCDGRHTVFQIGNELKARYGSCIDPVFDRLSAFIRILIQNKLISLEGKPPK